MFAAPSSRHFVKAGITSRQVPIDYSKTPKETEPSIMGSKGQQAECLWRLDPSFRRDGH